MGLRLQFAFAFVAAAVGFRVPRSTAQQNVSSNLTSTASCQSWCEADHSGGNNQGRHCAPGDMAHLCGSCSFCQGGGACESWCEADYSGGNNQGRHCAPGDMAGLCGGCSFCGGGGPGPSPTPPPAPSPGGRTIKIMSYNTEYTGYHDGRIGNFANHIRHVAPAIVGLQECQDRDGLASRAGYTPLRDTGSQNYIMFDTSKVSIVSGGSMSIPTDGHAPRAITWGHFKLGGVTIYFFNTHLPHNIGEARPKSTHARIARMLLQKRRDLGIDNEPTIVVGDMNSFASDYNNYPGGGFESNLEANGFVWAYRARGNPGYGGLDHILYSAAHWTHTGCRDAGTGSSDHPAITCDVTLRR